VIGRFPAAMLVAVVFATTAFADLYPSFAGRVNVDAPVETSFVPSAALSPWRMMFASGMTERADGTRDLSFSASGAPGIKGTFRSVSGSDGGPVTLDWTFRCEGDVCLQMFGLMVDLRLADYGGGLLETDGVRRRLPVKGRPQDIHAERVGRIAIDAASGGRRLTFDFVEPVDLFIQYWGGSSMSFRLILPPDERKSFRYAGGVVRRLAFALSGAGKVVVNKMTPVTIRASDEWIPLVAKSDIRPGSALDFSRIGGTVKPTGSRGRVVARGGHFEFADLPGVSQRFYGVNLCNLVNYPESLEDARRMVGVLTRVGYNAVRIHHHDSHCVDRSDPAGVRLDETMMRRMDALMTACAEEGVYVSTDLFVSRTAVPIAWRSCGVDRPGNLTGEDMKYTVAVHEGVYSNFLAFAGNFLNHTNAYTRCRYADDPTLAWLSLVNEGNLDEVSSSACTSRPGWQEAWERWLVCHKRTEPEVYGSVPAAIPNGLSRNLHGRAFLRFLQDVEFRFARRTTAFVRNLGCRALLTDMNNGCYLTAAFEWPRGDAYDYVDTHFYVDHPSFLEKKWERPSWCPNRNPFQTEQLGVCPVAAVRVLGRPFTISEYNYCGPGRFRGVGGIATGALAALQDWAGLWRFTWSHSLEAAMRPGTRGVGYFDIASDPLQLASERASVCLFLRRDLEPLNRTYAVMMPKKAVSDPRLPIGDSLRVDWLWAAWHAKVGAALGSEVPEGAIPAGDFTVACGKERSTVVADLFGKDGEPASAGDGHVRIDRNRGAFLLSTARTAGGFAESGKIETRDFTAEISGSAATVWVSSLDGCDIVDSRRMLLSHLTDVQNTGAHFADSACTVVKDLGRIPYLMRDGEARVRIRTHGRRFVVYALESDGSRRHVVPSVVDGDWLCFSCRIANDRIQATFLYEILAETSLPVRPAQ